MSQCPLSRQSLTQQKCFVHILEKYLRKVYKEISVAKGRDRSGKCKKHKKEKDSSRKLRQ